MSIYNINFRLTTGIYANFLIAAKEVMYFIHQTYCKL
jgi:hypothetical protein